jgi:hypothetical protein
MQLLAGAAFATALALGPAVPAAAATTTHPVSPQNIHGGVPTTPSASDAGWYMEDTRVGGGVTISNRYGGAPGSNALVLSTNNTNVAKAQLFTYQDVRGVPLADVTGLSYSTYRSSEASGIADAGPAFQLRVDTDGNLNTDADQTNLVYEPYWNDNGADESQPLTADIWQSWDATEGNWWSSKAISCSGGTPDPFTVVAGAGGGPGTFTSPQAVADGCPGALVAAIGANVGSFNPNYIVGVDGIHFQTASIDATWDFGPK